MLRILHIVEGTSVDGPGLRTSIYMAGCNHHCPGCHNPDSWDRQGGEERTLNELMQVIAYNVWCFTGFTWEEILASPELLDVVAELDVLVDGPFVQSERDISLRFRGSRNQRLIDVQRSLEVGEIVLWPKSDG